MHVHDVDPSTAPLAPARPGDPETLKILIVSTPKTGNTWLRNLLAAAYGLPMVELSPSFDAAEADRHGRRWIAHQHFYPEPALLSWAAQNDVVLLTTIRHPGDVLVSLYHYVHNYIDDANAGFGTEAAMAADERPFGEKTAHFVRGTYHGLLNISIQWMDTGRSLVVRYEDLWRDPAAKLAELTNQIRPVERPAIERAVEQCDISVMRKMAGSDGKFFRKGGAGNWRDDLPPDIVALFDTVEPYPAVLRKLGYTFADETDDVEPRTAQRAARVSAIERFANGVAVPPIAMMQYLSFGAAETDRRWPDFADVSDSSFYAWMSARAEADPSSTLPIVTNLAAYVYRMRPDLQARFPDLYGQSRADYVYWFIRRASHEYQLGEELTRSIRLGFKLWANSPSSHDTQRGSALTQITNLAAHIHHRRLDLQSTYPDIYGADRVGYVRWFIQQGMSEYELDRSFILPIIASWTANWLRPRRYASLWQLYTALATRLLRRARRASPGGVAILVASAVALASQSGGM